MLLKATKIGGLFVTAANLLQNLANADYYKAKQEQTTRFGKVKGGFEIEHKDKSSCFWVSPTLIPASLCVDPCSKGSQQYGIMDIETCTRHQTVVPLHTKDVTFGRLFHLPVGLYINFLCNRVNKTYLRETVVRITQGMSVSQISGTQ